MQIFCLRDRLCLSKELSKHALDYIFTTVTAFHTPFMMSIVFWSAPLTTCQGATVSAADHTWQQGCNTLQTGNLKRAIRGLQLVLLRAKRLTKALF